VADDADREQEARHARSRVVSQVIREHEERPMGCTCGAHIGDSIDRTWHLANQVAEAVAAHVRQEERERIAREIDEAAEYEGTDTARGMWEAASIARGATR
jgi:signal transduction histidine kinase